MQPLPSDPAREYRLLDLKKVRLLSADEAFHAIVTGVVGEWDAWDEEEDGLETEDRHKIVEEWLIPLTGIVFAELARIHQRNPDMYKVARRGLMDRLKVAELAARAEIIDLEDGNNLSISYEPGCSDDPAEGSGPSAMELGRLRERIPNRSIN